MEEGLGEVAVCTGDKTEHQEKQDRKHVWEWEGDKCNSEDTWSRLSEKDKFKYLGSAIYSNRQREQGEEDSARKTAKSGEKGKEVVEIGHVKKGPLERKRMHSLTVLQTKCLHLSINKQNKLIKFTCIRNAFEMSFKALN